MITVQDINARYQVLHDNLTESYYKGLELTKEEFDTKHGKIWNDRDAELIAAGLMEQPQPQRDLESEIDVLKARLATLEK